MKDKDKKEMWKRERHKERKKYKKKLSKEETKESVLCSA
jgi:hypothetical protein